jgi:Protein of unknown function (DUF3347)
MKTAAALAFVLAFATVSNAVASEPVKAIVNSYLEAHAALANDKLEGVKAPAAAMAAEAEKMGSSGAAIAKQARALEQAKDLNAAREAFNPLSESVIAAAKAAKIPDVKVAYCPMVKGSWLQKDNAIKNPYYGSQMLTCGEFKK